MKIQLKPSTCLAPLPAVIVTCGDESENNALTLAWAGTVNSEPPIVTISVRYNRHSFPIIERTGEFTVNLIDAPLTRAMDICGVTSGKDTDKFAAAGITRGKGIKVKCPHVEESPLSLECKVIKRVDLPTHAVFFGEVLNVLAREEAIKNGRPAPERLVAYTNGSYRVAGDVLGTYGYTLKEQKK